MATIRIKRRTSAAGNQAGAPSALEVGELAFNEVDSTLYIGRTTGGSTPITAAAIGGAGAFVSLSGTQTATGSYTFNTGTITLNGSVTGTGINAYVTGKRLNEFTAPNAAVSFGSQQITNLAAPTADAHAATKKYVDDAVTGATPTGVAYLAANNTFTGTNTFNANTVFTTSVTTNSASFDVFNTNATTVNAFGAAIALSIGGDWGINTSLLSLASPGDPPATTTERTFRIGAPSTTPAGTNAIVNILVGPQDAAAAGALVSYLDVNIASGKKLQFRDAAGDGVTFIRAAENGSGTITVPTATGTLALTNNKLSAFAATTSEELRGVIFDETGTGLLVFGTSPQFTTSVTTNSTSFDVFNTTATTVNAFGAATTLNLAASSVGSSAKVVNLGTGLAFSGTTINIGTGNTTFTTNVNIGTAPLGTTTINSANTVVQNLTVNGSLSVAQTIQINGEVVATRNYVDALKQGLDIKDSVRVATTANITLSGLQSIDDVTVSAGDRVLVKNQSPASQNGIYVAASGAWTRSTDANTSTKVSPGLFVFVESGTTNADTGWVLVTDSPVTLDTTNLAFSQFSSAGQVNDGAGLVKVGNTISVGTASTNRIVVNSDDIDLATVGTAGTYRSVTTDAYGRVTAGTNPTTFAGYGINDSSTNLAAVLTDTTGTGSAVFATSPALAGIPTAPTAAADTNTTQIATTAFVIGQGYVKSNNVCAAIADCTIDGGTF